MMLDEELRGSCKDGYTPEKFQRIARSIEAATGTKLCCIWTYVDDWGYGGDSEFYVQEGDRVFEVAGDLWPWLSAAQGDLDAPAGPGEPLSWKGPRSRIALDVLATDGSGNYAFEAP